MLPGFSKIFDLLSKILPVGEGSAEVIIDNPVSEQEVEIQPDIETTVECILPEEECGCDGDCQCGCQDEIFEGVPASKKDIHQLTPEEEVELLRDPTGEVEVPEFLKFSDNELSDLKTSIYNTEKND